MNERAHVIAVVDDDPRLLASLKNLFESAGYGVCTFSTAKALLGTELSGIDCIITDICMPAMDGFQLRDIVKKLRPDLPVFLITGRHEIADRRRVNTTGIGGFFRKPFDWPKLVTAVDDALRP